MLATLWQSSYQTRDETMLLKTLDNLFSRRISTELRISGPWHHAKIKGEKGLRVRVGQRQVGPNVDNLTFKRCQIILNLPKATKLLLTSGQSYNHFTLVNYDSSIVIWGIFKSGTTLEV